MSLLKFSFPRHTSPPDRYRATCPDGYKVVADDRDLWLRLIRKHHIDNNIPLADGWQAQYEHELCLLLPAGMCRYEDGTAAATTINTRFTQDDWLRGMSVLAAVVTGDDPLVDKATAESRARICAACPANVMLKGCGACVQMADYIMRIVGKVKTEAEGKLAQCGICHCSNAAQVWVKPQLLAKGVTPEMMTQFATLEHCWKGKELSALLSTQNP